jgi:hypothetical protein
MELLLKTGPNLFLAFIHQLSFALKQSGESDEATI